MISILTLIFYIFTFRDLLFVLMKLCIYNTSLFFLELNEHCNSDDECVVENSRCMHNKCDCKVDYVLAEDDKRCLKAAFWIDEECEQQSQCQMILKHSQCGANGTCDCVAGSHRRGRRCYVDVGEYINPKRADSIILITLINMKNISI